MTFKKGYCAEFWPVNVFQFERGFKILGVNFQILGLKFNNVWKRNFHGEWQDKISLRQKSFFIVKQRLILYIINNSVTDTCKLLVFRAIDPKFWKHFHKGSFTAMKYSNTLLMFLSSVLIFKFYKTVLTLKKTQYQILWLVRDMHE